MQVAFAPVAITPTPLTLHVVFVSSSVSPYAYFAPPSPTTPSQASIHSSRSQRRFPRVSQAERAEAQATNVQGMRFSKERAPSVSFVPGLSFVASFREASKRSMQYRAPSRRIRQISRSG